MNVLDQVRLIVYRCHEKGLEVFLVNTEFEEENWRIPFEEIAKYTGSDARTQFIALDPTEDEDGKMIAGLAVEGDWHDIPSLRKLAKGDVQIVASKLKFIVDHGAFFSFKEALKKLLPHEYQMLHELKEILADRNMVTNI